MKVNELQKTILTKKIKSHFKGKLKGKTFGIWGLAFKPDTDDIREAPALYLIDDLLEAGAKVRVYDPEAMPNVKEIYGDKVIFCKEKYEAIANADALVIVTEWGEFISPSFEVMDRLLKNKIIFDGRNVYNVEDMKNKGYHYESIGREVVQEAVLS